MEKRPFGKRAAWLAGGLKDWKRAARGGRDLDREMVEDLKEPRHSMFGIFTYIGVVLGVNVGIYGIHGVSGEDRVFRGFSVEIGL